MVVPWTAIGISDALVIGVRPKSSTCEANITITERHFRNSRAYLDGMTLVGPYPPGPAGRGCCSGRLFLVETRLEEQRETLLIVD